MFALDQNLTFEYQGINFLLTVTNLVVTDKMGDQVGSRRAQLVPSTGFLFEVAAGSGLKIAGQKSIVAPQLFKHKEFNFEKLGIGGLDSQFEQIFRRAFASRVFAPSVVERLGIHHVKGVLLFGPPGTGGLLKILLCRYSFLHEAVVASLPSPPSQPLPYAHPNPSLQQYPVGCTLSYSLQHASDCARTVCGAHVSSQGTL